MEFTLYFKDADDAMAAQRRIETRAEPIETLDDVRTDLVEWLRDRGQRTDADYVIGTARKVQEKIRDIPIEVTWPAAHDGDGNWEMVVEAEEAEQVQEIVGVDLDYAIEDTDTSA